MKRLGSFVVAAAFALAGSAPSAAQSPEVLRLLPADTASVAAIDLARIRTLGGPFAMLSGLTADDPALAAVDRLVLASPLEAPSTAAHAALAVFEGRFRPGWRAPEWARSSEMAVEVLSGNLAVAGRPEVLQAALRRFREPSAATPWLERLSVVPPDAAAWVYTREPARAWSGELEASPGGAAPWVALLGSLRGAVIAAAPAGSRLRIEVAGESENDGDAQSLADAASVAASFAAMTLASQQPLLGRAIRDARIVREGRLVRLSIELSETEIPGLLSTLGR